MLIAVRVRIGDHHSQTDQPGDFDFHLQDLIRPLSLTVLSELPR